MHIFSSKKHTNDICHSTAASNRELVGKVTLKEMFTKDLTVQNFLFGK